MYLNLDLSGRVIEASGTIGPSHWTQECRWNCLLPSRAFPNDQGHCFLIVQQGAEWPFYGPFLVIIFISSSLFGGQFRSSAEAATHSQEQLSQARHLALTGSRAAQGTQVPKAAQQSPNRRAVTFLLHLQLLWHTGRE